MPLIWGEGNRRRRENYTKLQVGFEQNNVRRGRGGENVSKERGGSARRSGQGNSVILEKGKNEPMNYERARAVIAGEGNKEDWRNGGGRIGQKKGTSTFKR